MECTPPWSAAEEEEEGPVMRVFAERLRNLRKKLNRISQMEKKIKGNNKSSVIVAVAAAVDELENLRPSLSATVEDEISLALSLKDNNNTHHHHDISGSSSKTRTLKADVTE